jgi:antitoxin ChpS
MHTTRLRKVGGSVMLAVPPSMLETLGLAPNKTVGLVVVDGELIVKSVRPRYSLDELLAQCDPEAPMSDEDREWLDTPPVGRESI